MEPSVMLLISAIHVVVVLAATCINVGITQRRLKSNAAQDNQRLRLGLHSEMQHLLTLYQDNVDRLERGVDFLLSSRSFINVYKCNLNRLHFLIEAEIPSVVSVYAFNESIEGLIAATCKANGPAAYKISPDEAYTGEIIRMFQAGQDKIRTALDVLEKHIAVHAAKKPVKASVAHEKAAEGGILAGGAFSWRQSEGAFASSSGSSMRGATSAL